jgi:hypothetical protein
MGVKGFWEKMKNKLIIGIMMVLLIMLAAAACEKNPETSAPSGIPPFTGGKMEPIPPGEMITHYLGVEPGTPGAANDDIVYPPGGPTYRAKVHEMDKPDWPPVEEVTKSIEALGGTMRCQYREYIDTATGEIRNNILYLFGEDAPDLTDPLDVEYYVAGLPDDIGIILGGHWYGGAAGHNMQSSKVVFQIDITPQVNPGECTFYIVLMYEGEQIAALPCMIKVIE